MSHRIVTLKTKMELYRKKRVTFRSYRQGRTLCPVTIVTPPDRPFIHTFFDICPWSPSGRYLLCLMLPFENREPRAENRAGICVIDLQEKTIECVYETRGWAMQVAAHQQWGNGGEPAPASGTTRGCILFFSYEVQQGCRSDHAGS